MTNENVPSNEEAKATPPAETESEELSDLFEESEQGDSKSLEERLDRMEKGLNKFFSQKGRESKEQPRSPKETPTQSSEDVTELFLESKPEAELVKDDLKKVADKLYDGSIIKAWKNEQWLQEKASKLSEESKAKSKISNPSNQIEGEIDFKSVKEGDVSKMDSKTYAKYQDYMRKKSVKPGKIML